MNFVSKIENENRNIMDITPQGSHTNNQRIKSKAYN